MVYYIIHKCYNNYTFGALFARFALKILLKTFVHVQFCSKFKFQHFYPLLFECHTYAVNPVIVDLRCVLVKTSLSRLSQMLWRKVAYSVVRRIVRYHCELTSTVPKVFTGLCSRPRVPKELRARVDILGEKFWISYS